MTRAGLDTGIISGFISICHIALPPIIAATLLPLIAVLFGVSLTDPYRVLMAVTAVVTLVVFRHGNPRPDSNVQDYLTCVGKAFGHWLLVIGTIAVLGYILKISAEFSRRVLLTWALLMPFAIGGARYLLENVLLARIRGNEGRRTAIMAGVNEHSRRLGRTLRENPRLGVRFLGYFDDRSADRVGLRDPGKMLGKLDEVADYARRHNVDVVYLALPIAHEERARQLIEELQDTTASLYFVPNIFVFDLIQSSVDMIDGIPILGLRESPYIGVNGLLKKASDLILGTLLTLIALPAMLLIGVAIKLTTPGSVIFKQRRYGMDGQEIIVYKFRTMTSSDDDDNVRQATVGDDRITPLGGFLRKYSLDELPQLLNVIQGRMSVVGPRPHAVAHNEMYRKLIRSYMVRHKVPPGITGLAQVNGMRGETRTVEQMEARVAYDLEYLRSWSIGLDLQIIAKTVMMMFRDKKAY